ncbi:SBBP repeat-containing protein [Hymenobacter volaticus]|uniref:SBBP repeat-containing protein n=1 Tax=Hymenobacter volaticus TaxID=2932254 RepID=A0ABY4G1N8_9BACT|nr:SBBP repeat-containing protein [Hymenobacter volaticus]UOQ64717.1 SBBP repeat-containing protein [Hymenobacter volaticus]
MKHIFTRLLPAAAGVLLSVPVSQAQVHQPQAVGRARKALPTQIQNLLLPLGTPALQHALPGTERETGTSKISKKLERPIVRRDEVGAVGAKTSGVVDGPVSEEWIARYSGYGNSFDGAKDVVADAAGNVYVTGYSFGSNSYDYVTVKYSASGQQLWATRYNGASQSDDVPTGIALDAAGNVYVTGASYGTSATGYNYATVKYNGTNGQLLFSAIYTSEPRFSTLPSTDLAADIATDAAGNVYVTGSSYGISTNSYDYTTLKYSTSGQLQWVSQYIGSGTSTDNDLASNLALDNAGNVYVAGNSYRNNQGDYLTVKYSNGGTQLWASRYNGPANGYDLMRDLAVDANGSVYITGTSDNGSNYDYATVRYSTSGQQLWATRYNGAGNDYDEATSLVVDNAGNAVVTGYALGSNGTWDYTTIKYAVGGQPLWESYYNSPDNSYDEARDVAVDAANNVFVTGRSYNGSGQLDYATAKYAAATGQQLWASRYSGTVTGDQAVLGLAVDGTGNVAVTGASASTSSTDFDYATLKYAGANGQQLWQTRYSGPTATSVSSEANDVALDAAGNVYVTGSAYNGSSWDLVTIKYSASGQQLWEARYLGNTTNATNLAHIALDATGNVYVTGRNIYDGTGNNFDYATIKYNGVSGQQLWEARYEGSANGYDSPTDLAVDANGNVYVTGYSNGRSTGEDYATLKYDGASGQQLWVARYSTGSGFSTDEANALALDALGNIYVTGSSQDDYATIKYSSSGQQLWVARYTGQGPYGSEDVARDIAVDAAGDVYVTGNTENSKPYYNSDYATVKYAGASGQQLWLAVYNSPVDLDDYGTDLVVDGAGNVFVTGYSASDTNSDYDYATVKYAGASGQQLWETRYDGGFKGFDSPYDLAVDASGNAYVTGISSSDYATVKYDGGSGQQIWQARYNGPSNMSDTPAGLAVDAVGNVYVTGVSVEVLYRRSEFATIKYSQTSSAASLALATARPTLAVSTKGLHELSVYPNPATGPTTISFRPVGDGTAQVRVYNQLGQQVASLYEGKVRKGQHYELPLNSEKLAAGLYTCSLLVNGQRESVRLVVTH